MIKVFSSLTRYPLAYDISLELLGALGRLEGLPIECFVLYGIPSETNLGPLRIPTLLHLTKKIDPPANTTIHNYSAQSNHFILPQSSDYDSGNATVAHSRSLVFLRKWLGGPIFDLEAIWDEHCYFEFEVRSVAKTMATMVASNACLFAQHVIYYIFYRKNRMSMTFQQ